MLEIIPYVGGQPLTDTTVAITVSRADQVRAEEIVERCAKVQAVVDESSFQLATRVAGDAKSMLTEIEKAKKEAKRPFGAVEKAIDKKAAEFALEVQSEHNRILALLNSYVRKLEAERKAQEDARAEALRRERAAYDEKIRQAQEAKRYAELAARQAQDEAARLRLEQEAFKQAMLAEQEKLAQEMAAEMAKLDEQPQKGLVPGGRVDHPLTFKLVDLPELINNHRLDLLRWELNVRACQDDVRLQLERHPDRKPVLPGIAITQDISVSVKATRKAS